MILDWKIQWLLQNLMASPQTNHALNLGLILSLCCRSFLWSLPVCCCTFILHKPGATFPTQFYIVIAASNVQPVVKNPATPSFQENYFTMN